MKISRLPIDGIIIENRLRELDPAHVETIAASMAERGQLNPVGVRFDGEEYFLVSGEHRLAAAAHLGWAEIDAAVDEGVDDDESRLRQIDENLMRHDLNALDRAVFLAERKTIYEARNPDAKKGGDRRSAAARNQTGTMPVWSFSADAAAKTGLDETTIRRAVRIAENIAAPLRKRLAGTAIAKNQGDLLALAKLEPEEQPAIVDLVTRAENPLPTIRAAVAFAHGKTEQIKPEEKRRAALQDAWDRAGAKTRRLFVEHLVEEGFSDGAGAVLCWVDTPEDDQ